MKKLVITHLKTTALALCSAVVLAACSGGGGTSGANISDTTNQIKSEIKSNVQLVSETQSKQIQRLESQPDGSLNITYDDKSALSQLKSGEIVSLPPSKDNGLLFGFTGKVVKKTNAQGEETTTLQPAAVEDVFRSLDVDIDTANNKGIITGVYTPKGVELNVTQHQTELLKEAILCNEFVNGVQQYLTDDAEIDLQKNKTLSIDIKNKYVATLNREGQCATITDGALKGQTGMNYKVDFSVKKHVTDKGSNKTYPVEFFGEIDLKNMRAEFRAKYDENNTKSTDGWIVLKSKIQGEYSLKAGFKGKNKAEMPSLSEMVHNDGKNVWDNLDFKLNDFVEINGLDGDDKKGLFPLGGLVLTVPNAVKGGNPFLGDLSAAQLDQYKKGAIIIWLYLRADGSVVISGEGGVNVEGQFVEGADFKVVNNELKFNNLHNTPTPRILPYVEGEAEFTHSLGANVSADLLVGGVRPLTVQADLLRYNLTVNLKGDGGYVVTSPNPQERGKLTGNLCLSIDSADITSNLLIKANIKAKLKAGIFKYEAGKGYQLDVPYTWYKAPEYKKCLLDKNIQTNISHTPQSNLDNQFGLNVDYRQSFTALNGHELIDGWKLVATNTKDKTTERILNDKRGFAQVSLPYGYTYDVKLVAFSKNYGEVKSSTPVTVKLGTDNNQMSITNLQVKPTTVVAGSTYQVVLTGDMLPVYQNLTINGCDEQKLISATQYQAIYQCRAANAPQSLPLVVFTPDGKKQLIKRGIEINDLPTLTYNLPTTTTLNKPYAYSIAQPTGDKTCYKNYSIDWGDGSAKPSATASQCLNLANLPKHTYTKAGAYTVSFSFTTNTGQQVTKSHSLSVQQANTTSTTKLTATGITTCGDYAYGNSGKHNNNLDCSLTKDADGDPIPAGQDGHVQAGQAMSYTLLNRSGDECVQDNVTGLIWEQKTDDNGLRDKDNSYTWYNSDSSSNGGAVGYEDRHDYSSSTAYGATCGNTLTKCNTQAYIAKLNADNYCGYSDWRMPTRMELVSIVDYGQYNPSINAIFTNTKNSKYWSASPGANNSYGAWSVHFNSGYTSDYGKYGSYYVRAVRASQ